jgi:ABC-type transport system substrate-binding protein
MRARGCTTVSAGPKPTWRECAAPFVAAILVATLTWGCGTPVSPAPTGSTTPSAAAATATPAPTPSPTAANADTLRIGGVDWGYQGMEMDQLRQASGGTGYWLTATIRLGTLVYSGLYRYDARYNAVPDLAHGPCLPQADPKVIRCRIVETTFHDGTPLTADDVAYTYQLFMRPTIYNAGATGSLSEVRVVDPRTVDFVLSSVDPTFLSEVLPTVWIVSRRAVEAAYASFVSETKGLRAADLTKVADAIDEEVGREPPVCMTRLDAAGALLAKIGVRLYREDFSRATGTFQACTYMGAASGFIRQAAVALRASGVDGVAAAFQLLATDWQPIGTGPYRFVSEDADRLRVEAWPAYHGGLAATHYVDFVPTRRDGSDLLAGTVDVLQFPMLGAAYKATASAHGVEVTTPALPGFVALMINVRPGHLFADRALRQALQLCIDLPRDVDAATGGGGTPAYGPVLPGSWADDPNLPRPGRDTAAARRLIENAGWAPGPDGVFARDGVRLAADILVRGDAASDRIQMADLIASQARDCGVDLRSRPTKFDDLLTMLTSYPHDIPGTRTPFDLYLGIWANGVDPADGFDFFASSNISDPKHPDGLDYTGFSDPTLDALISAGKATYDTAARTRIYREAQQELAAQQPYVFLWANNTYDVVRAAVRTVDGPLDLTGPDWCWQPERMVVAAANP